MIPQLVLHRPSSIVEYSDAVMRVLNGDSGNFDIFSDDAQQKLFDCLLVCLVLYTAGSRLLIFLHSFLSSYNFHLT